MTVVFSVEAHLQRIVEKVLDLLVQQCGVLRGRHRAIHILLLQVGMLRHLSYHSKKRTALVSCQGSIKILRLQDITAAHVQSAVPVVDALNAMV
jgi:hypothetical protein